MIGWISICMGRKWDQLSCQQRSTTISKDACGTYWVSVLVDDHRAMPDKAEINYRTTVGVDLGITDYAILSDGTKYANPKHFDTEKKTLARLQKAFARTKQGSKRHEKARREVAREHRKIVNRREDFLHKLSTDLVRRFDTICLEDLNVLGMLKGNCARSISDAAWRRFVEILRYKADWYGKNLMFLSKFDPSSQLCHKCGYQNPKVKDLSVRTWRCPRCGMVHDRDVNAALNIKSIAFRRNTPEAY